jgi:hypothetical protein
MIYWILADLAGKHGRRHDGRWEPLSASEPAGDDVERFHRLQDAVAKAKKLAGRRIHCKPMKQEGIVFYWRLPEATGDKTDMAEVVEFRSTRQADAWKKRAIAEGCEVIECLGTARPAKRKGAKK